MTDAEKIEVLKACLVNIGRLLPVGAEIHFFREEGDPRARMQIVYSDGAVEEAVFVGCSPIYKVPTVEAV